MTAIDHMRQHVERLIAELRATKFTCEDDFHVHWIDDREKAMALSHADLVEIWIPEIRTPEDYATCLHELGRLCGRYQKSAKVMTRERWAWNWARDYALCWTAEMKQDIPRDIRRHSLASK